MATNLLLSTPGIEFDATIDSHTAENATFPAENAIRPQKSVNWLTSAAVTQSEIVFDLGSGNTEEPDHLIITRLDMMTQRDSADITVLVSGDDNNSFSTPTSDTDTPGDSDLIGPDLEDWYLALAPGSAERYWRLRITTTQSEIHEWNYVRFGTFFDIGRDPTYGIQFSRGVAPDNTRRAPFSFGCEWHGITDANYQTFLSDVVENADRLPIFFYDTKDHTLGGHRMLSTRCISHSVTRVAEDTNNISAFFTEFI